MSIVFLLYHPSAFTNWVNKLSPFLYGTDVYVLHISKLHGVQPNIKSGYRAIDISYYSFGKLKRLLQDIHPDLFVFLSFRSLLEYTINRLCVSLNVRKIYLEHGLFSTDTLKFRKNELKKEIVRTIRRQFAYWYLQAGLIICSKHPFSEIKLANEVYRKSRFKAASYNHYYIFSKRSFDCYKTIFDLNNDNVTYIGYPIFNSDVEKEDVDIPETCNGVLYVHQPLISDGIAKISFEEEKLYWEMLANALKEKYGDFTVLLHPRANLCEYEKRFEDTAIKIMQSPNNYKCFSDKSLIIGHYSTALLYGLYFNKPTVIVDYPTTETASMFKQLFVYCDDIDSLSELDFHIDIQRKKYVVGEHNTFEYIAATLLKDMNNGGNIYS